jgi:hypothetical protein
MHVRQKRVLLVVEEQVLQLLGQVKQDVSVFAAGLKKPLEQGKQYAVLCIYR